MPPILFPAQRRVGPQQQGPWMPPARFPTIPSKYEQLMSASLDTTGSLVRQTSRPLPGGLSFVGSLVKQVNRPLTAGLSFVGAVSKRTARAFVGGQAPVLTFSGSLVKRTSRALAGGLSFSGSLASARMLLVNLTATLSFSGSLSTLTVLAPFFRVIDALREITPRKRYSFFRSGLKQRR